MKQLLLTCAGIALLGLVTSGCGSSTTVDPLAVDPSGTVKQPAGTPQAAATADSKITVQLKSWDETQQLVAQNAGKVVVIDLWTSW